MLNLKHTLLNQMGVSIVLSFSDYLKEETVGGQGQVAASKGVAYETALSKALSHNGKFAEKHEDENGMTAEEAYHHTMSKLPQHEKVNVEKSIPASVEAIRNHLLHQHNIPLNDEIKVYWTSKPGQVAKTTGRFEDHNNPSDLLIFHPKSGNHIGLSLKFGLKPGLRSPGIEDLHNLAKTSLDKNKLEANKHELLSLGGPHITGNTQSERNKSFRMQEKNSKVKAIIDSINKKSLEHRTDLVSSLVNSYNKLSFQDKTYAVKRLMNAEESGTQVVKIHHNPISSKTHVSDPIQEFKDMHIKVNNYHFEAKGMYINIVAEDKTGNKYLIAKIGIKHNSSPMTHVVGSVSHSGGYKKLLNK